MKIIQIAVDGHGILYALTDRGRIFRRSLASVEWTEIDIPSAKETFIPDNFER